MKKLPKRWRDLLIVVAVLAPLLAGELYFITNYRPAGGGYYPRHSEALDLRGRQIDQVEKLTHFPDLQLLDLRESSIDREQYRWLRQQLPDCEILWELEIQGKTYPPDVKEISLPVLEEADLLTLQKFPRLEHLTVEKILEFPALPELMRQHQDLKIDYSVEIAGKSWPKDTQELTLEDPSAEQFRERIPYLPEAEAVTLTGVLPPPEEIEKLRADFPWLKIQWRVDLGELSCDGESRKLFLDKAGKFDPEEFLEQRPWLPALESVNLLNTELTNEEKHALVTACPDIDFQWEIGIWGQNFPGDAQEAVVYAEGLDSAEVLRKAISCFAELKRLVVLDSQIPNEELDALDQEFPDTRVVWNLNLGGYQLMTDDIYYAPNKYSGIVVSDEILEPLQYCRDMVCVDVGHRNVTDCSWAANMPKLKYLILADTNVRDISPLEGLENLVFFEAFITPIQDYSPLLTCKGLEDLNLCYSHGDPEPVKQMTWLKRLWWDGDVVPQDELRAALPDTEVQCYSGSSTGLTWRKGQHYYDMRDLIGMKYLTG